jgi:hypothetical protein
LPEFFENLKTQLFSRELIQPVFPGIFRIFENPILPQGTYPAGDPIGFTLFPAPPAPQRALQSPEMQSLPVIPGQLSNAGKACGARPDGQASGLPPLHSQRAYPPHADLRQVLPEFQVTLCISYVVETVVY